MTPPGRVAVVGAGLAGLSAALHLRGADVDVVLIESGPGPGGRAAGMDLDGASGRWALDVGPTVLTLPEVAADAFAAVGHRLEDRLDLVDLDPAYRACFADGSHLDLSPDLEVMHRRVRDLAGPAQADGYLRYVGHLRRLFEAEYRTFIDRNVDTAAGLMGPDLARVAALGGFSRLSRLVERFLDDERLRRVFSFQALYAGVSPEQALAVYAVISYLDLVHGVVYPRGGVRALPEALAGSAEEAGVQVRYGTTARWVERSAGRVRAVVTDQERIEVDAVVLTPELPTVRALLGSAAPTPPARHSPSCVLLAAGVRGWTPPPTHHTIGFGRAWAGLFDDLDAGRPMRDPSYLLSVPTRTDPGLAPGDTRGDGHVVYLLFPAPNLDVGPGPRWWDAAAPAYRRHMLDVVERSLPGLSGGIEVEELITPADWGRRGMAAGTPFAAAHTLRQTGPWRTGNVVEPGVVLAGSSTIPGVGVPMVLVSGRLAAERLTGPRPGYRSLAWP